MGEGDSDDEIDIDCRSVVEQLYTFLDGELAEAERLGFSRHLTGCVGCHEVVEFHAELKMVISEKCRDQVPDALRRRIADALGFTGAGD